MASTIIIKNGAGSSTPSSLKQGELAINVDNGKLFFGTSGSSNAVSSSFSFQHITASGEVSSSSTGSFRALNITDDGVKKFNVDTNGHITASGDIRVAATSNQPTIINTNGIEFNPDGNANGTNFRVDDTNMRVAISTVEFEVVANKIELGTAANQHVTASGEVSSSSTGSFRALNITDDGVAKFNVDTNGHVSASGDISSSATLLGTDIELKSAGVHKASIDTSGNVAAEGAISSSGLLSGTSLDLRTAGVQKASISADGTGSFFGGITTGHDGTASLGLVSASRLEAQGTDEGGAIVLRDNDGNVIASFQRVGSGGNAHVGKLTLRDNGVEKVNFLANGQCFVSNNFSSSAQIEANSFVQTSNGVVLTEISNQGAISASSTIQGTAFTAQTNGATKATIDASGNISASGTITTSTLIGNGSDTILASDGKISASGALLGNTAQFAHNGTNTLDIDSSGNLSTTGTLTSTTASLGYITASQLAVQGTDHSAGIYLYDNDGNNIAALARVGSGGNAHVGRMVLRDNANVKVDIRASGTSYIMGAFSSSGAIEANSFNITNNGDNVFNITNAGAISASSTIQGTAFTAQTNGVTKATIDASGNVAAEGTISGSGQFTATNLQIETNGAVRSTIDASGNLFAASISSSGKLSGTDIDLRTNGAQVFAVNTDGIVNAEGGISSSGLLSGTSLTLATNGATRAAISALGEIVAGAISSSGVLIANTVQLAHNGVNTLNISNAGAISASSTIQGTALTLQDAGINTLTVDTIGNVSSSATGSFRALTIADDGVTQAAIDAEGGITGSKFQGTQHLLHTGTIYINDDPFVQNSVYFGNSTGNQPRNWNDPQASGGTLGTQTTISISEDDTRWGMILPCDVSQVEIQCSVRPGGACSNDNFFVGLYTAARPNDGGANYDITLVAHNDSTFQQGKYTTNDFTYTGNLDKGSLIFVGIGSEDATAAKNAPGLLNVIITQR